MTNMDAPIPISDIEDVLSWVDTHKLSRTTKKLNRDFSDAVLLAEMLSQHYPKLVEMHNYPPRNGQALKMNNWMTLSRKVLKKLKININYSTMEQLANSSPGAIERLLVMVYEKVRRDEELAKSLKESEQNMSSGGSFHDATGDDQVLMVPIKTRINGVLETVHQKVVNYDVYIAMKNELEDSKEACTMLKQKVERLDQLLSVKEDRINELQNQLERKTSRKKTLDICNTTPPFKMPAKNDESNPVSGKVSKEKQTKDKDAVNSVSKQTILDIKTSKENLNSITETKTNVDSVTTKPEHKPKERLNSVSHSKTTLQDVPCIYLDKDPQNYQSEASPCDNVSSQQINLNNIQSKKVSSQNFIKEASDLQPDREAFPNNVTNVTVYQTEKVAMQNFIPNLQSDKDSLQNAPIGTDLQYEKGNPVQTNITDTNKCPTLSFDKTASQNNKLPNITFIQSNRVSSKDAINALFDKEAPQKFISNETIVFHNNKPYKMNFATDESSNNLNSQCGNLGSEKVQPVTNQLPKSNNANTQLNKDDGNSISKSLLDQAASQVTSLYFEDSHSLNPPNINKLSSDIFSENHSIYSNLNYSTGSQSNQSITNTQSPKNNYEINDATKLSQNLSQHSVNSESNKTNKNMNVYDNYKTYVQTYIKSKSNICLPENDIHGAQEYKVTEVVNLSQIETMRDEKRHDLNQIKSDVFKDTIDTRSLGGNTDSDDYKDSEQDVVTIDDSITGEMTDIRNSISKSKLMPTVLDAWGMDHETND